jgi:hypothetical protein
MLLNWAWGPQFVSIMSRSRDLISTLSKSASPQSRNLSWDRDFSILSRHQCPDQKVSIEKFIEIWKFWCFSTVCWSRRAWIFVFSHLDFSIHQDFSSFSDSKGLDNVKISWQISTASWKILTILTHLDKSQQSQSVSTISTKILTRQSLDWKVSISKISTRKKKLISNVEKISTLLKSWSWH